MRDRSSGVLMHISSLPGKYGIGDFGLAAYKFCDFLKDTGTKNWQILPLGITGYGDSPYQSFSAFAGNPYFIDLTELIEEGYLTEDEVNRADLGSDPEKVSFEKLYFNKMPLLRKAYSGAKGKIDSSLLVFIKEEGHWLDDFSLYMAIKTKNGGKPWISWEDELKNRDEEALKAFKKENKDEIFFWVFTQYYFFKQWRKLKDYANSNGIKIIGDIPIYVSIDGSDVWSNPQYFDLNKDLSPRVVAGCPPDEFSKTGQLWGNPIYRWDELKKDDYSWFVKRIEESFKLYDVVRIDHFRGFESYWEIPGGDETAEGGKWVKGPSLDLFKTVNEKLGEKEILAEDLGFLTKEVKDLIKNTGYPGMKVLVFAFSEKDSDFLPHNYDRNSVVYTSNHDTQTVEGFVESAKEDEIKLLKKYTNKRDDESYSHTLIREAFKSVSYLAVVPMQDLLELNDSARFNIPSTLGNNWEWRMRDEELKKETVEFLKELNEIYRR